MKTELIDGNPHWLRVQEIAETFTMISKSLPKAVVDMSNGGIPRCANDELCYTSACHAGWFQYFSLKDDVKYDITYDHGSDQMADHLGFNFRWELSEWADKNPKIWGNENGDGMFSSPSAFLEYGTPYSSLNLKIIAAHWQKVAKRLCEIQDGVL